MGELLIKPRYKSIKIQLSIGNRCASHGSTLLNERWGCICILLSEFTFWIKLFKRFREKWASLKIVKLLASERVRLLRINPKRNQKILESWNFCRIWLGWKGSWCQTDICTAYMLHVGSPGPLVYLQIRRLLEIKCIQLFTNLCWLTKNSKYHIFKG